MHFSVRLVRTATLVASAAALITLTASCGDDGGGAAGPDAGSTTLYERLGEEEGIEAFVDTLVAEEVKDPEIAAFFAENDGNTPGRPSVDQIKECLVLQISAATGGPQTYPATTEDGFTCRTMAEAHQGLGISSDVFDKFVSIAATVAMDAGIEGEDLQTIADFLNGTKSAVVE